jgi:mono/diheme cytochrome c family protein
MRKREQEAHWDNYGRQFSLAIIACLVILGLLITLSGQAQENSSKPQKLNPYTGNAEAIAEGEQLYKMLNCYGCHGMQGGGGMGPNITDDEWKEGDGSDALLLAQLMEGRANMPSYKDVIDQDQAWKLIAFVRTLYKGDPAKINW